MKCVQSGDECRNTLKQALRSFVRLIVRRYPIYSGVMRLVNTRLLKALTFEHEVVVTTLRSGPKIVIDVNDYCGRPIYYWGDYDSRITELCIGTLRPGDVMLDIGANYGEIALAAAARVGDAGAVHAFEPNPAIAGMLRRSIAENGFANLVVHELALGDFNGVSELVFHEGQTCAGTLLPKKSAGTDAQAHSDCVQVRVAEELIEELGLSSIAVVKVDVEGMDSIVLRNMSGVLAKYHPRIVLFESWNDGTPFFERESVRVLTGLGYRIDQVKHKRVSLRTQTVPIRKNDDLQVGYDFVAILDNERTA